MTTYKNTTVAISSKHDVILTKLTVQAKVSKKEYIEKSLEYFNRFGINPIEFDSPSDEMKKLIKKLDQIIAFTRVQERDILKPACATILKNEQEINRTLDNLATNKLIKSEFNTLYILLRDDLKEILSTATQQGEAHKQSILELAKAMDEKNRTGLTGKIKDLFS